MRKAAHVFTAVWADAMETLLIPVAMASTEAEARRLVARFDSYFAPDELVYCGVREGNTMSELMRGVEH